MNSLRLGMIGLSPGNGHPYSWAAIFNGYDPDCMEQCGFPVIPRYLEKQSFPRDAISDAKVTHVWAQESKIATKIARAALIPNVVDCYTDMIGKVDGILLARDDAETHFEMAAAFLEAGIPVYIDKPLAFTVNEAIRLLDLQRYPGQIFSCSALRYAKEFQLSVEDAAAIGEVSHIHAMVPNDWNKYAIHIIEPVLLIASHRGLVERSQVWRNEDSTTLMVKYSSGFQAQISTLGSSCAPLTLRVIGKLDWKDMFFEDTFFAFRSALAEFVAGIVGRTERIEPKFMLEVVDLIERGGIS
jgi:hypothetical protein